MKLYFQEKYLWSPTVYAHMMNHQIQTLQKNKKRAKSEKQVNPQMEAIYKDLEEKLKKNIGTKVLINRKNENSGKIEIEYYSHDELDRIVNMLNSVQNQQNNQIVFRFCIINEKK